jgi:hypothetical protein
MKKRLLFLVSIICLTLNVVLAEHVLILTNLKSNETTAFRKGSYLVFELKSDNSMHEGFIREIRDSSIVFDDAQVALTQINVLAGSTRSKIVAGKVAHAVGTSMLYAGLTVFDCGTNLMMYNDYYYWPLGGTIWLAGAFISGLGYAFDWALTPPEQSVRVRNYKDWNANIIEEGQPYVQKQISQPKDSVQTTPVQPKKESKKKSKPIGDDVYGN